jgi:hypothetical protein
MADSSLDKTNIKNLNQNDLHWAWWRIFIAANSIACPWCMVHGAFGFVL